jgi:hypothetical protein
VVATGVGVDVGSAPEFGGDNDEGILEETAVVEVGDEAGEAFVEGFAAFGDGDEVGVVGIPTAE